METSLRKSKLDFCEKYEEEKTQNTYIWSLVYWSSFLILINDNDSDGTGTGITKPILALVLTVLSRVLKVMSTDAKGNGTNNLFIDTES